MRAHTGPQKRECDEINAQSGLGLAGRAFSAPAATESHQRRIQTARPRALLCLHLLRVALCRAAPKEPLLGCRKEPSSLQGWWLAALQKRPVF